LPAMSNPPSDNLFISELPEDIDLAQVQTIFGAYGKVTSAKLLPGQGRCAALVRFNTEDEATWIVDNLHGNIPQGLDTPIQAKYANQYPKGKGKGDDWSKGGDRYTPYGKGGDKGWGKSDKGDGKGKSWNSWDQPSKGGWDSWSDGGKGGKSDWSKGDSKGDWGKGDSKGDKGGKGKGKDGDNSIKAIKKGLLLADALPGGKWSNDQGALWIGGLPPDTTDLDLYHIFAPFGSIPSAGVRAMCHPDGNCKGYGFVNFLDDGVAQRVIETLNGTTLPDGSILQVKEKAAPKEKGEGKGDGKGDEGKGKGGKGKDWNGGWQSGGWSKGKW